MKEIAKWLVLSLSLTALALSATGCHDECDDDDDCGYCEECVDRPTGNKCRDEIICSDDYYK